MIDVSWDRKPESTNKNLLNQWERFNNQINVYCNSLEEYSLPGRIILNRHQYLEYIFSILTWYKTGLGP